MNTVCDAPRLRGYQREIIPHLGLAKRGQYQNKPGTGQIWLKILIEQEKDRVNKNHYKARAREQFSTLMRTSILQVGDAMKNAKALRDTLLFVYSLA